VGFVVDKVAMEQVFLLVIFFYPVSIIPLWLSVLMYYLGNENTAVDGRSSETWSHPIDMNNNLCVGLFFICLLIHL
jgi:hypothetical protein